AELVERGSRHRDLGWMLRIRVDDTRPQLDARGDLRRSREKYPRAAQEQVITHPEGVEPRQLGAAGKLRVHAYRQVVVEADAEAHLRDETVCFDFDEAAIDQSG